MNSTSISRELARFVHGLSIRDLSDEVIDRCKSLILDAIGLAVAGRGSSYVDIALRMVKGNRGEATVFMTDMKAPLMDAAFVNAILINSIGQDDTLFMFHPGTVVMPAALAAGEESGRSGAELITAIVAGYDLMGRVCLGASNIVPRFRGVSVFGPFGSAGASGKLLGLNEDQLANALGYAANLSSGFAECWVAGSMEGKFHMGIASRNGVMAALLGKEGATAAEYSFEGKSGFYQAFAGRPPDLSKMTTGLGKKFMIMEAKYKAYPVCGLQQSPVDMALTLMKQHGIQGKDIEKIIEIMSEEELVYPGTNCPGPFTTRFQAIMSAQFCAAAAFSGKPVASYSFYDRGCKDPEIAELAKRVELIGQPERARTKIEVTLKDGKQYSIEAGSSDPLIPSIEKTRRKFESLAYDLLGKEKGDRIIEMILNLDNVKSIAELTRLLRREA